MTAATLGRRDVLRWRFHQHGLRPPPSPAAGSADVTLLDYGVQDTGTDGATWALANRGAPGAGSADALAYAWTLRGAPHAYRRSEMAAVAVATAPWSEADAAKRIFDASKPLKAAGIPVLDALRLAGTVTGRVRKLRDQLGIDPVPRCRRLGRSRRSPPPLGCDPPLAG